MAIQSRTQIRPSEVTYSSMAEELVKIAQSATGLSGMGTHISRTVKQRGGTFNMMTLGLQDNATSKMAEQILQHVNSGETIKAKQLIIQAQFPSDMRNKLLGTVDNLRANPAIPTPYRHMMVMNAFDPSQ